jgi:aconitate decarboxylase
MTTEYTRPLSEFISQVSYDQFPAEVVHQVKRSVLDSLACGLFGSHQAWSEAVVGILSPPRGDGAVVWGWPGQLSAADAALATGTFIHGFELDDLHKEAALHVSAVTLPATLGLAQVAATPVSGRDLITAQVAGYEAGIRVGLSCNLGILKRGFHNTGVVGAVAASAAASRVLKLDPVATWDAIGCSGSFASGLGAAQFASSVKRAHAGRAAQSGVYAAELGRQGFRGIRDLFENHHGGFYGTFAEEYDPDELLRDLGTNWRTAEIGHKVFPTCAASQTSVEAALGLREQVGDVATIEKVHVTGPKSLKAHVGWDYVPDTVTTAQMNLSFAVAAAFLDGQVGVDQFAPDRLADPRLLEFARKVDVVGDPAADARGRAYRHAITMTVTADGQEYTASVDHVMGTDTRPITDDQLAGKFYDLAPRAVGTDRAKQIYDLVQDLESLPDVRALAGLLASES